MKNLFVKILGATSPYCKQGQACPSYFVSDGETYILLDAGSGSHSNFDMENLSGLNIFVSHLHRDHYNDIFNYQYASYVLHGQGKVQEKIHIYLPEFNCQFAEDIKNEEIAFADYHEIKAEKIYEIGAFKIEICKLIHTPQFYSYATKIQAHGKIIVYSGDVSFSDKDRLAEFAKGADMLICEASLLESYGFPEIYVHLTAAQAGKIAAQAEAEKLMLTHFWPEEDRKNCKAEAEKYFSKVLIAKEGELHYL